MSQRLRYVLLAVVLLNLAGIFGFHEARRQNLLWRQLEQSVSVLAAENAQAANQASNALESIRATVAKNHNQPSELARLRRAEALHEHVAALAGEMAAQAAGLRRRTGNAPAPAGLRVPGSPAFGAADGEPARRWLALRAQLAACADTLRRAAPGTGSLPTLPAPAETTTIVEALADLTGAASRLLAAENHVLARAGQALSQAALQARPVLLATPEACIVAPGDTYRAQLLVMGYYPVGSGVRMARDGHPVPVDAAGIGQVRFRAPSRPGPAAWTGTIRVPRYRGRDSTFAVRVPYRVARRR